MTREEYIFKHASEIAERKARTARSLQSEEAQRLWGAMVASLKSRLSTIVRPARRAQPSQD